MALFHRRSRWFVVQALFSCWLAVLLAATVPLSLASAPVFPLLNQAGFDTKTSPFTDKVKPLSAGKYELAKVRILGVPAITVASAVLGENQSTPDARKRAEVIEGNLRLLYDPNQLCSQGERLSEWLLEKVVTEASDVCSRGLGEGLVPSGEPLKIEIAADAAGNQVLQAVLKGRHRAFRILTVTEADAEINGLSSVALARRWKRILQSRVNHARATLTPQRLAHRWRLTVVVELILLGLIAVTLWGWTRLRRKVECWQKRRALEQERRRGLELRLHGLHAVTRVLMVLVLFELVFAVGLGVMAVPGQIPLGIEVLLQPSFAILKVAAITVVGLLLRALSTFLLHQWADNVDVMAQERARRDQRYRSLLRVIHRLIDVSCILVAGLWILLDIPGVKATSLSILLFGGALLGALAIVFQGLLRDFVAGLLVLVEDRYAIGDWIEIDGIEGEVMDVGLFSTQMRCLDQRVDSLNNSSIHQLRNHTKLRSGKMVTFVISHQQRSIDAVIDVLREQIELFLDDAQWNHRLLSAPVLRGVRRTTPMGVHLEVLLLTHAGEQWVCEREFQLRVLRAFETAGIQLANGLDLTQLNQVSGLTSSQNSPGG